MENETFYWDGLREVLVHIDMRFNLFYIRLLYVNIDFMVANNFFKYLKLENKNETNETKTKTRQNNPNLM